MGEGWGEGIVRDFGMDTYAWLYLEWITNRDLLYSTWNSAQCYLATWMGGEFGEKGYIYIYMAESLCCTPKTITTLSVSSGGGGLVAQSCPTARLLCPWDFLGKNTGMDCYFILQGIFPSQELNLSLLHSWVSLVAQW